MRIPNPRFNSKGLTLIECVIAILILVIMIAGGLTIHTNATAMMNLAMQKKIALEAAVQEMEKMRRNGYAVIPSIGKWENLADRSFDDLTIKVCRKVSNLPGTAPNDIKNIELAVSLKADPCSQTMTALEAAGKDSIDPKIIKLQTYLSP